MRAVEATLKVEQFIPEFSGYLFETVDLPAETVQHALQQFRWFEAPCSPPQVGANTVKLVRNEKSRCPNNSSGIVSTWLNSSSTEGWFLQGCGAHTPRQFLLTGVSTFLWRPQLYQVSLVPPIPLIVDFKYLDVRQTHMSKTLSTVERSYEILHTIMELDGARVTVLAAELDMPKSTVHKHLKTLTELRYAINEGGTYHIGLRYLNLGSHARNRRDEYPQAIQTVKDLATATEERVQFVVEEHGHGIYLHIEAHEQGVRTDRHIGQLRHLHTSAAGKAILANLPNQHVDEIIDRWGLPAETDNTIIDKEKLMEELKVIRERGIAFNDEESIGGLRGVGVPVLLPNGQVLGSFSVAGPAHRLKGQVYREEIPDLLLGYANKLELNLEY